MKKIICILLVMIMVPCVIHAEEMKDLTFEQLYLMQMYVNAEIMSRPEWKEVIVPSGIWVAGRDIPAGSYSISIIEDDSAYIQIRTGTGYLAETVISQTIQNESDNIGRVELKDGYVVKIESGALRFAPPVLLNY